MRGPLLDKEGKHATSCSCRHALSARHNALSDELADIARRTGRCADTRARMDMRVSKQSVQDFHELIDVQVTSPFCAEAGGKEGKAAANAESKKRTKYWLLSPQPPSKPTDEWERHSEPSSPESPQRTSKREPYDYKTDLMHPADPQRAYHRQVQRHHLTPALPSPSLLRPVSLPALTPSLDSTQPSTSRPLPAVVVPWLSLYCLSWSFVARPWLFLPVRSSTSHPMTLRVNACSLRCLRVSGTRPDDGSISSFASNPYRVVGDAVTTPALWTAPSFSWTTTASCPQQQQAAPCSRSPLPRVS